MGVEESGDDGGSVEGVEGCVDRAGGRVEQGDDCGLHCGGVCDWVGGRDVVGEVDGDVERLRACVGESGQGQEQQGEGEQGGEKASWHLVMYG